MNEDNFKRAIERAIGALYDALMYNRYKKQILELIDYLEKIK